MDRAHLEAFIWQHWPTRGTQATQQVDAILDAADAYAITVSLRRRLRSQRPPGRPVLRHTSDTDLYPAIGALADALLGTGTTGSTGLDADGCPPYEVRREYLESA